MNPVFIILALSSPCFGDASVFLPGYHEQTMTTPKPYSISYSAGHYPGHVDRVHQESGDNSGVIHGSYAFVDPKHEYTADKIGFHPSLGNHEGTQGRPFDAEFNSYVPGETVGERATNRHLAVLAKANKDHNELWWKLANFNSRPPRAETVTIDNRPRDRHLALYDRIAREHAAIGAQRAAGNYYN